MLAECQQCARIMPTGDSHQQLRAWQRIMHLPQRVVKAGHDTFQPRVFVRNAGVMRRQQLPGIHFARGIAIELAGQHPAHTIVLGQRTGHPVHDSPGRHRIVFAWLSGLLRQQGTIAGNAQFRVKHRQQRAGITIYYALAQQSIPPAPALFHFQNGFFRDGAGEPVAECFRFFHRSAALRQKLPGNAQQHDAAILAALHPERCLVT